MKEVRVLLNFLDFFWVPSRDRGTSGASICGVHVRQQEDAGGSDDDVKLRRSANDVDQTTLRRGGGGRSSVGHIHLHVKAIQGRI